MSDVSVHDRKNKILSQLKQHGIVRVAELSPLLGVTDETIRKDLDLLSQEGKLQRTHGGAISLSEPLSLTPHLEREHTNVELKMAIAEIALKHIQPHDTIAIDGSTSVTYLAKIIPDIPLTVLTNSMKVAFELSNREHINVIAVGGNLLRKSHSFHGAVTERVLKEYHVNKAFLSCTGLHVDRGFSDSNEAHASVKQRMIEIADSVYFLVDSSKLGVKDLVQIAPIGDIDYLITDSQADAEYINKLREAGLKVITQA
ncbi:DeoR/GlpR family DNA-binding transcription regulator [Cohnella yongneupensis]|uniref:DeoR/GlpR family DNA-binding transcription regulator n=1 Tax=Cohnella yongneupensis TaxID=425006 RepID=A0ABW0QXI2_9BACL